MIVKAIVPGVYAISFGMVNAFLLEDGELTLIDTGMAGRLNRILLAMEELGKKPTDLKHILATHLHADHTGGLAALKKATGATTYMHPVDAASFQRGEVMRRVEPAPGLLNRLALRMMTSFTPKTTNATVSIDRELYDGQVLDFAGGLQVIHAPGHTAGQVVFLWPKQGGVLFLGDAAGHFTRLNWSPIYENFEEGKRSLRKLSERRFETAAFSHGAAITGGADQQFKARFGAG